MNPLARIGSAFLGQMATSSKLHAGLTIANPCEIIPADGAAAVSVIIIPSLF